MTRALWIEWVAVCCLAAALAAALPLYAGEWSWSWDALNHHVYLGFIAEQPRWHLDVVAASVQTFQYPYLYWPLYRLTLVDLPGATVGAIWGAAHGAMIVAPLWLLGQRVLRQEGLAAQAVFERLAACALGVSSVVVLAAINTTANDPMSVVPVLWAAALMAVPLPGTARAAAAAALFGVAVAFKLSNALLLPLLLVWWWQPGIPGWWWRRGAAIAGASAAGFVVAYAPWGWQLWRETGNPFYPMLRSVFGGA